MPALPTELYWQSATLLGARMRQGELSSSEIVRAHLQRISETNPQLNAFLHVCENVALDQAGQADCEYAAGTYRGPLHGLPVAYKDIFHVHGLPTTAHSRVMTGHVAAEDSEVARRVRNAGGVNLGKLNTTEFASGGMEVWGVARNPWDTRRSPGSSSAGAGAAVAAGMVPLAIASDTGGSTRIPAAFCGVFGLQATSGRISRKGMLPVHSEMDCVGLMARSARDIAVLLQSIAESNPPGTSAPTEDFIEALDRPLSGLCFGVPRGYFFDEISAEIDSSVGEAIAVFERLGVIIHPIELKYAEYAYAAHWCVTYSETYPRWRDSFFARRKEFGDVYVRKIASWAFLTGEEVTTGRRLRQLICQEVATALERVDLLITPTTPIVAPYLEEFVGTHQDTSRLTRITNLAGVPALAVPCGFTSEGLPMSLQLIGKPWREDVLLTAGHVYEKATGWPRQRRPALKSMKLEGLVPDGKKFRGGLQRQVPDVDEQWVRRYADLHGLTFLSMEDCAPIARQLSPIRSQLKKARTIV